jgi:hypothetical protein
MAATKELAAANEEAAGESSDAWTLAGHQEGIAARSKHQGRNMLRRTFTKALVAGGALCAALCAAVPRKYSPTSPARARP